MPRLMVVEAHSRKLREFVRRLARRVFSDMDAYWVERGLEWDPRWAKTLVLLVDDVPVGFDQVYVWPCCGLMLGVHHYAAVDPEYQGRGYGRLLIASGEEVLEEMGAEVFAATLSSRNIASRRMLESLGYSVMEWRVVEEQTCSDALEELMYVTGGYGDDLVALKGVGCPPKDPFEAMKEWCKGASAGV